MVAPLTLFQVTALLAHSPEVAATPVGAPPGGLVVVVVALTGVAGTQPVGPARLRARIWTS